MKTPSVRIIILVFVIISIVFYLTYESYSSSSLLPNSPIIIITSASSSSSIDPEDEQQHHQISILSSNDLPSSSSSSSSTATTSTEGKQVISESSKQQQKQFFQLHPDFRFFNKTYFETEQTDFCRNAKNPVQSCYDPRCYVSAQDEQELLDFSKKKKKKKFVGGCTSPNPFYNPPLFPARTKSKWAGKGKSVLELDCVDRKPTIDREEYFFGEQAAENEKKDPLFNFKKHSSWMFNKWYNWGEHSKCVSPTRNSRNNFTSKKTQTTSETQNPWSQVSDKEKSKFKISGGHSNHDTLYRLKNVCIRPNGKLMGYLGPFQTVKSKDPLTNQTVLVKIPPGVPKKIHERLVQQWSGSDDVMHATRTREEGLSEMIHQQNIEAMPEPADCYLSKDTTKVILYPITKRSDNDGHTIHRFGSMLRSIQSAFGDGAMRQEEELIVGFVATNYGSESAETKDKILKSNYMSLFYDMLGTSWFSTYLHNFSAPGKRFDGTIVNKTYQQRKQEETEIYGFTPDDRVLKGLENPNAVACFEEVVIWQNAYAAHFRALRFKYGLDHACASATAEHPSKMRCVPQSYHIHGPRSPRDKETLKIVNERIRKCLKLPPRRKEARRFNDETSPQPPHILIIERSSTRRFSLAPFNINFLARNLNLLVSNVTQTNNKDKKIRATLEVIDRNHLSFKEFVMRLSNADVIVGVYGASLTFVGFAPPGAVVIEFGFDGYKYTQGSGVNLPINGNKGEFGGCAVAASQYHIALEDNRRLVRYTIDGDTSWAKARWDLAVPNRYFDFLFSETSNKGLGVVQCLLAKGGPSYKMLNNVERDISELNKGHDNALLVKRWSSAISAACQFNKDDAERHRIEIISSSSSERSHEDSRIGRMSVMRKLLQTRVAPSFRKENKFFSRVLSAMLQSGPETLIWKDRHSLRPFMDPTRRADLLLDGIRIAIVEPCAARVQSFIQLSAFRQIFLKTRENPVGPVIIEYALGREFCSKIMTMMNNSNNNTRVNWKEAGVNYIDGMHQNADEKWVKLSQVKIFEFGSKDLEIGGYDLVTYEPLLVLDHNNNSHHDHEETALKVFSTYANYRHGLLVTATFEKKQDDVDDADEENDHLLVLSSPFSSNSKVASRDYVDRPYFWQDNDHRDEDYIYVDQKLKSNRLRKLVMSLKVPKKVADSILTETYRPLGLKDLTAGEIISNNNNNNNKKKNKKNKNKGVSLTFAKKFRNKMKNLVHTLKNVGKFSNSNKTFESPMKVIDLKRSFLVGRFQETERRRQEIRAQKRKANHHEANTDTPPPNSVMQDSSPLPSLDVHDTQRKIMMEMEWD